LLDTLSELATTTPATPLEAIETGDEGCAIVNQANQQLGIVCIVLHCFALFCTVLHCHFLFALLYILECFVLFLTSRDNLLGEHKLKIKLPLLLPQSEYKPKRILLTLLESLKVSHLFLIQPIQPMLQIRQTRQTRQTRLAHLVQIQQITLQI
jgi:hypothetical protein